MKRQLRIQLLVLTACIKNSPTITIFSSLLAKSVVHNDENSCPISEPLSAMHLPNLCCLRVAQ